MVFQLKRGVVSTDNNMNALKPGPLEVIVVHIVRAQDLIESNFHVSPPPDVLELLVDGANVLVIGSSCLPRAR